MRRAVEIGANLTNAQIRELLKLDLSKVELLTIAKQRSISTTGMGIDEIKRKILKNLERQESYKILGR